MTSETGRRTQQRYSVNLMVDFDLKGQPHRGHAENMSVGGLFMWTTALVSFGETVRLRFTVPDPYETIEVDAQVRWIEKKGDAPAQVGLQFSGLRARHVWALNKFLADKEPVG